jgi:hypothetical protein
VRAPGRSRLIRAGPIVLAIGLLALATTGAASAAKKHKQKFPIGPYPSLGKCQVFPTPSVGPGAPSVADQSAWNQDVSGAPVDPNSAAYVANINGTGGDFLHPDFGSPREYGFPYAVVGKKAKRTKVNFLAYGDESDRGRYRIPGRAPVEGGPASDGDRHVLTVDRKRCKLYELYRGFFRKSRKPRWDADSGVIWNLRSAALRTDGFTSADAAGLPIFPGLVRYDEVQAGAIRHAIRVTVNSTQHAWVHPASHCAGDTGNAAAPPMGLRLRLGAGYDISGFTGAARVIATALKRYGLIVADNGSNWYFSGTSDRRWDDENLNQLKSIPGSAFEVVQSQAPIHPC